MTSDQLMLNDDKPEFIVIASRHLLKKGCCWHYQGRRLQCKHSVCRAEFGCVVRWKTYYAHITKICSAAFHHLHNIRCIRKYLSVDAAAIQIHSFVSSRIGYCNSLLYGVPKCHIDKLQRVQNAAARLVVMQGKFCHLTPMLHQLHWPPVSFRINFKILPVTFKAIYELAPSYIKEFVKIKPLHLRYRLQSNDRMLLSHRILKL